MTARLDPAEWLWIGLALFAGLVGLLAGVEPKLAIAVSIAFGFVLLVFVDLSTGLALFTVLSFLENLPLIGKATGILLALSWLAVVMTRPDARSDFFAVHPGMSAVIGGFLGWTLLSAVWAESPGSALASFSRYLPIAMLFFIVFTAVRTRKQALLVAASLLVGAVGVSIYGLYAGAPASDAGRLAVGGVGDDPNGLASALVVGLALSIGVAANLKRYPGVRLAAWTAGAFCVLGVFFTVSRGGLIALGVSLIAALFLAGRWRPRIAIATVLITIVTVYYFTALAPPAARERITQSTSGQAQLEEGRTTIWAVGERMARANLIKGVGAGNFRISSPHYLLAPGVVARSDQIIDKPLVAHNMYLEILAETGIVGLALFGAILVFSLVCCMRAAKVYSRLRDRAGELFARALAIGLIGNMATGIFLSQEYDKPLWILLGLGPALLSIARSEAQEAAAQETAALG
jgi:O-antigen ligase